MSLAALESRSSTSPRLSSVSTRRSTLTLRSRRHTEADALAVSSASGLLQPPRERRAAAKRRKSKRFPLFFYLSMSFLTTMSLLWMPKPLMTDFASETFAILFAMNPSPASHATDQPCAIKLRSLDEHLTQHHV
jgi:hypothetical protein